MQSLEQEINERKADTSSSTAAAVAAAGNSNTSSSAIGGPANKSKLSDALDKLFCKQKEKEQQQQQKQTQKASKQSKRLSSHSIEERIKSPVDMDIEPKELNEREDMATTEARTKYSNRGDDVQKQSLAGNDTCNLAAAAAAAVAAIDPTSVDVDDQLRPSTNKYEQEQFVNNMPKPPTPKSSMIFSPPPTSLTIDKRESIFDFAENFSITNDASVSLLSFNSESIFKEDSAKETMDLVANLRQNIKKGGKADECARTTSSSSAASTKAEPANQTPTAIDTNASPDSTTIDANVKSSNADKAMSLKSMDAKSKAAAIAALQQPTLVIDLDQENSSDESKPPTAADEPVPIPSSTAPKSMHKDTNWIQTAHAMDKERGGANLMNMLQQQQQHHQHQQQHAQVQPTHMQHQTEVEQIASKMPGHIQTPADMLAENELNEAQNMNAFHVQPYANNAFNGNKEAFDRTLQMQVTYTRFYSLSYSCMAIHFY